MDAIGGVFSTQDKAQEIADFFAKHPNPGIDRKVKQAIERTELRAAWRDRDLADIKTYLRNRFDAE